MALNKAILLGRLTGKPTISMTGDGKSVAKYTLAVDSYNGDADFINIVAFRNNADFASKYLDKGTKIIVEGRIKTGSYTNKEGKKVYTTDVIAEHQEFAESKKAAEENTQEPHVQNNNDFMVIPEGIEQQLPFA